MLIAKSLLLVGAALLTAMSVAAAPVTPLKPGEYVWAPAVAPDGPVTVIVSLKLQRAFAYRNGVPIGVSTISSGKPGHLTPTGVFTILQKDVDHKSNRYSDAPMPFMQRLTWSGIAMHAGHLPGYPASHGCIRLPADFAKLLFGVTKLGLTVVITDDVTMPETAAPPPIFDRLEQDGHQPAQTYRWHPQSSPKGPLSIVVSGRDHRVVVLRNGIEIGASSILIDGPVVATEAFTLAGIDRAGVHWLRLPLPRQPAAEAGEMAPEEHARAHLPEGFRAALTGVLQPGATLLITRDTLRRSATGQHVVVLAADKP
jgi:hypothetical protein